MFGIHLRGAFAGALLVLGSLAASAAQAVDYKIIAPLRGLIRADTGAGYNLFGPPNISGDFVVFTSRSGPPDGVWSYQISNRRIRKLVGFERAVPGGRGKFTAFGAANTVYPTTVGGDVVVFFGRDADNAIGIYTINVLGGPITKIASAKTDVPGGTGPFKEIRYGSTNGSIVAFYGLTQENSTAIFKANVDGTGLETVIDGAVTQLDARTQTGVSPDYFGLFSKTGVGVRDISFYAGGLFDPSSGANAIFRARGFSDLADNVTSLEGGTDGTHVRISDFSAAANSSRIAIAADEPNTGYYGIFRIENVDFASAFVTLSMIPPGASKPFTNFLTFGLDLSGLAFTATYTRGGANRQDVFFTPKPGGQISLVASGAKYYLPYVGDRSVDAGRVVFTEGTNFADTFFLATPQD